LMIICSGTPRSCLIPVWNCHLLESHIKEWRIWIT
jgi:hypothetical protein